MESPWQVNLRQAKLINNEGYWIADNHDRASLTECSSILFLQGLRHTHFDVIGVCGQGIDLLRICVGRYCALDPSKIRSLYSLPGSCKGWKSSILLLRCMSQREG